ncbi:MAG: phosphotransferase family protein [Candidatus Bathyarchaeota archaeon]|nr:MAG: phosphotransferase family protein [Candidatus Bathyarchaeota archaeon]
MIAESLADYLKDSNPQWEGLVVRGVEELTMGWETELYSFTVKHDVEGSVVREDWVVRLYPGKHATEKAAKEFKVMARLHKAGYPVPRVFHCETGSEALGKPFIIMELIKGRMLDDDLEEAPEGSSQPLGTFINLFAELHALDVKQLFPREAYPLDTKEYLKGFMASRRRVLEELGPRWLLPALKWLDERREDVVVHGTSLLHRDFHPMNIILREDGSPVVLDWGAASIGDFREDLAWTTLLAGTFRGPSLRELILESYEGATGREVMGIEFFEVIATIRRIRDIYVSLTKGAKEMGMREGAEDQMRSVSDHVRGVYGVLVERTGIMLPEFEELLRSL